jgi:hypothetical protein
MFFNCKLYECFTCCVCFFFFFFFLGLGVCTYKCRGPNLGLCVVAVLCFWLIYGVSCDIRVVHFAEGSFGTMGVCIEVCVLYVCRVVSWLELVVVSRVC